jgi:ribosomal protein S18 acetylase RimI-like enzyme
MALSFRPARADDADSAVPLIHASGPESFDYVFCASGAGQALGFLRFAFASGRGRFGWGNHTVACVDGRVVGIGTSYGAKANAGFLLDDGWLIARHYGLRSPGVMLRGLRTEQVIRPPQHDEWMIAHLAMAPEERGHGIGARMAHELIEHGRRAGVPRTVLDVSVQNPRAEALYRRLGFVVVVERRSALRSAFGYVPGQRRMALPIAP